MSIIIGIDHGYYAIKTAHCSFPAGLTSYGEHEPYTRQGLLEFGGCFFVCGSGRQPIQRDKTINDNYYLLTLAAIAKEIRQRGLPPECSVRIAAGLPLTSFGRDKPKFREYLLRSKQPVNYKFEGVEYSITIEEVAVFPQGYAALMTETGLLQDEPSMLLMDLGGWTVDLMRIDNAIPVACTARVVAADPQAVLDAVREMEAALHNEYRVTDPALWIRAEASAAAEEPMDESSTRRVLCMLACLPNGVQAMSAEIHGLVQTSLNLGILATEETSLRASFCVRSSVDSQREMLKDRLTCLMEELGGTVEFTGDYTGWQYREDSPLRDRMVEVFREQYGKEPKIEAIHAGLECGVFAGKLPGLDCVSIGPDLFEIHTPRERLSISSVQRIWDFVVEVLKRSK